MAGSILSVRLAALLSVVLAAGLGIYTSILFKEVYEQKNSQEAKIADAVGSIFNSGLEIIGRTEKVDPLKNINIKFYTYGAVIGAAVLQLLTSLLLLCCAGANGGRSTAKFYIFINTLVMLVIAGAAGCFLSTGAVDYQEDEKVQAFLGGCGVDFAFLFFLLCIAGAFIRS